MESSAHAVIPHRILIIRLSAIGDVVRTLPALSSLRRQFPDAHIAWAVEDKSKGILEGHPHLDEIIMFQRVRFVQALKSPTRFPEAVSLLREFVGKLRAGRFDLVLDFHGILKSGIIAFVSGSPNRAGFRRAFVKEFSHLFTNRKVDLADARLPRVERNLELVRPFVSPDSITGSPTLGLTESHRDRVRAWVAETFGNARPLVAVHSGTSRSLKKWLPRSFALLCDMLAESLGAKVMLTWGPGEYDEARAISSLARSRPELGMRTTSLLDLAALIERCDLMITVDSGPMHIGSAVGVPVVAIFGPTDVRVNAPYWQPVRVLVSDIDCRPCEEDCTFARCMEMVTPEAVFDAARELLAHTDAATQESRPTG
jgi:3-deoxy-D-manno-octulosonic-acid transferase/heptosyltransferase-1